MAQVTDNLDIADGSSIHQEAKQQLNSYLRNSIQPLMQTGKPLELNEILHRVTSRKPTGNLNLFSNWASNKFNTWFKYFLISNFVSGTGNLEGEVIMKLEGKLQLILFQLK